MIRRFHHCIAILSQVHEEADQDLPPQGGAGGGRVHEVGEGL